MKVAIYSRVFELDHREELQRLFRELKSSNITPVLYTEFYNQIKEVIQFDEQPLLFESSAQLEESFECMISLGGDGTLLDTVTLVRDKQIPLLGINFGRLGFLASIGKEALESAVAALVKHTFV